MQILDLPPTNKAMLHSLSLTGLVVLKKNSFKSRHKLPPSITQVPRKGFELKKNLPELKQKKSAVKKESNEKKERFYTVNKKIVRQRIQHFMLSMKGEKKLFFWTISFPVGTQDSTALTLLNIWLTRLRTDLGLKHYLWVSERQENGTIHFHLAINQRICVKKANRFMRASIMHSINKGLINYSRIDAMRYNGVDIAKDRKTKRVVNFADKKRQRSLIIYMSKYFTKSNEPFKQLAWHCSRTYGIIITSVRMTESEFYNDVIQNFIEPKHMFESEWCFFYKWKDSPPPQFLVYLTGVNIRLQEQFNYLST